MPRLPGDAYRESQSASHEGREPQSAGPRYDPRNVGTLPRRDSKVLLARSLLDSPN
jgi:hypothetical protein